MTDEDEDFGECEAGYRSRNVQNGGGGAVSSVVSSSNGLSRAGIQDPGLFSEVIASNARGGGGSYRRSCRRDRRCTSVADDSPAECASRASPSFRVAGLWLELRFFSNARVSPSSAYVNLTEANGRKIRWKRLELASVSVESKEFVRAREARWLSRREARNRCRRARAGRS